MLWCHNSIALTCAWFVESLHVGIDEFNKCTTYSMLAGVQVCPAKSYYIIINNSMPQLITGCHIAMAY